MKDFENFNVPTTSDYNRAFNARMRSKHVSAEDAEVLDRAALSLSPLTLPWPVDAQVRFNQVRKTHSVFRKLCRVVNVSQGDNNVWVTDRTTGAEWMAPGAAYPIASEGVSKFPSEAHKVGCTSTVSEDLALDKHFDLVGHLADVVGRRFALAEDAGIIGGSGENGELNGLTSQTTTLTAEVLDRAALLDIYHAVPVEYRTGATWILSDAAALTIEGLTDDAGRPLLSTANGLTALFNRPVEICAGCPDNLVLFGDLSTVWILDKSPLMVQPLTELYAAVQEVGFHCWTLLDVVATRPEAVAVATISTTE